MQDVYSERPNLYIGFHGCEKNEGMRLLTEPNSLSSSTRNHERLGHGFYVWENNIERALDWAKNHRPNPYKEPFVIGVVYTLGNCMDLTDKHFIDLLSDDYPRFVEDLQWIGEPIPQNTNPERKLRQRIFLTTEIQDVIFHKKKRKQNFLAYFCRKIVL